MPTQGKGTCKRCGRDFEFSDWAYRRNADRGFSNPEYCDECQAKHKREKTGMGITYFDLRQLDGADMSTTIPGDLGVVYHPPREMVFKETPTQFDPTAYGFTSGDARQIHEWLSDPTHQVVVLVGATGSGKSTAMPYLMAFPPDGLESFSSRGQIVITQPRQVGVNDVSNRLSEIFGSEIGPGQEIGAGHGALRGMTDWRNRVVLRTDGQVVNMLRSGRDLDRVSLLVIDEAHERNVRIDEILRLLRDILPLHPRLKVVIASATINEQEFLSYFGSGTAKIVRTLGKAAGYEVFYADPEDALPLDQPRKARRLVAVKAADKIVWIVRQITQQGWETGDILAFVPGVAEIKGTIRNVEKAFPRGLKIGGKQLRLYPLHREVSVEEKERMQQANENPDLIRIFVSTDIAQTSVTIRGLVYEVESGLVYRDRWEAVSHRSTVVLRAITQADAGQRFGRVGRIDPGKVFCLYTENQLKALRKDPEPEILRRPPTDLIVGARIAGLPFEEIGTGLLSSPEPDVLRQSIAGLLSSGIISRDGLLTAQGELQYQMPYESAITDLLLIADRLGCGFEVASCIPVLRNGGARKFLLMSDRWHSSTLKSVTAIHKALQEGCLDDIEFILKVVSLWERPPGYFEKISDLELQTLREAWAKAHFLKSRMLAAIIADREKVTDKFYVRRMEDKIRVIDLSLADRVRLAFLLTFPELARTSHVFLEPSRYMYADNADAADGTFVTANIWSDPNWRLTLGQRDPTGDPTELYDQVFGWIEDTEGEPRNRILASRVFLDQAFPIGSTVSCQTTLSPTGEVLVIGGGVPVRGSIEIRFRDGDADAGENGEDEPTQEEEVVFGEAYDLEEYYQVAFEGEVSLVGRTTAQVVGYRLDDLMSPTVILREISTNDSFEVFKDHYASGSTVGLEVIGYQEFPGSRRKALVVREPVSGLTSLIDPEDLSFTDSSAVVEQVPNSGSYFPRAFVWKIDDEHRQVRFSLLPALESWTTVQIEGSQDKRGTFEVGAVVIEARVPVNSGSGELTLLLDWSNPAEGAIYTVTALNGALAKPATSYQVGERALVQVYRENKLTREELVNLPFSPSDLESQSRLKWMGRKLECHGRMSFEEFCNLADLSEDRSYQRVLEKLYRRSNRLCALRVVSLGDLESLPGRVVDAKVKNVGKSRDGTPYGVFVEVLPGFDSLLHRTKMTQPLEEIANSKTVRVLVTDVNLQNMRVTVTQKGLV